jgi:ABC-type transporter Mla MlaB component
LWLNGYQVMSPARKRATPRHFPVPTITTAPEEDLFIMPMHSSYIAEELRLDLSFSGNLDVSVSQDICDICWSPPRDLKTCIVDISGIDHLFDSGVALLKMLYRHLVKKNVLVVIFSDSSRNQERMPNITS